MRYFITIFIFLISIASAANFSMPTYTSNLTSVKNGYGKVIDSPDIIIGSSGIVMHTFNNGESSIIARAVVTDKSAGFATVRFEVFQALSQPALPVPGILPKVGDKVILNYLYNRAIIVVPNEEIYTQIINSFPNIHFINPDLAASHLNAYRKPNPSRDDFRKICSQTVAGLIFIAMDKKAVFADCGSFEILKSFKTGEVKNYQVPFFSNVYGIAPAWWKWESEYITNYNKHYKFLLDIKD